MQTIEQAAATIKIQRAIIEHKHQAIMKQKEYINTLLQHQDRLCAKLELRG